MGSGTCLERGSIELSQVISSCWLHEFIHLSRPNFTLKIVYFTVYNMYQKKTKYKHTYNLQWRHFWSQSKQIPCLTLLSAAAAKSLPSCPTLCDPTDSSPAGSPSLGFSRQEYWSGLPFPSPMHESEVTQSCPTLQDPMDCSPPGSSVHGIFQARVLEWGAIAFSEHYLLIPL